MSINWQELITQVTGQGILVAIVAWLSKEIVSTRLKAGADKELERVRNELQIIAHEHQVRFSKLHERRAEVIAELFRLLQEALWEAQKFVYQNVRDQNERSQATTKVIELYRFMELHKLYFSTRVCALLDNAEKELNHVVNSVGIYWTDVEHPTSVFREEQNKVMLAACAALQTDIPAALDVLAKEFREMLGVEV